MRVQAPFGRRRVPVIGADDVGAYRVVHVADLDGPTPWPGQFYVLASAERWGGGGDERPYLPRALSFLGGRARTRMTAVEFCGARPGAARRARRPADDERHGLDGERGRTARRGDRPRATRSRRSS